MGRPKGEMSFPFGFQRPQSRLNLGERLNETVVFFFMVGSCGLEHIPLLIPENHEHAKR